MTPARRNDLDEGTLRIEVERRLGARAGAIWFAESTGSTNDEAKRAAAAGAPSRSVFVADAQTAGRGRQGRVWHSPAGANLYLSILLRPEAAPAAVAPFALVVGLAVAEEVDACFGSSRARVKWPNDVWIEGRKIAGILLEASIAGGRVSSLVVGVGVDVHTESFPEEIAGVATSLAILGAPRRDRAALAAGITARVVDAEATFVARGFAPFLEAVRARDALAGRRVRIDGVTGRAEGVADDGCLQIRLESGELSRVVAGHVELLD